ncbi:MAG: aldolase [Candidatus Symbiothrix sp.]|jgi:hypothetical protein|nr:aldolase [Candidatus Symbiothrix sp.]
MLQLMYITNVPEVAAIAQQCGVDRIFVDLETIGKKERQGGMNTVQSAHTVEDVQGLRKVVSNSRLLIRSNPVHKYFKQEIEAIIKAGADIIMLPYFKTVYEVQFFLSLVDGRAKTCLLFETKEAVEQADTILDLDGIDEAYIGLNDLHLSYGLKFMFELLTNGCVDQLCEKFKAKRLAYGFGGLARLNQGMLPAGKIIAEHYRLGSSMAILSRTFCNVDLSNSVEAIRATFYAGLQEIRNLEYELLQNGNPEKYAVNRAEIQQIVNQIVNE